MLQAIREGDRKMYRLLFERYYPSLCAYGNRFVQLEEAKEIAQDSLLWLWEHREEVTIESSLSGYLLSMVYHRCVNLLLQNQARLKAESRYLKAVEEMLNEEDPFQFNELQQQIKEALASLPDTYREALCCTVSVTKAIKRSPSCCKSHPKLSIIASSKR